MTAFDEAISEGRAAYLAQSFEKSAEAFTRALSHSPDDLIALFGSGNALLEMRRDSEALVPLQRAATLAPENADVRNSLGIAYRRLKRYEEAIPHLEAAASRYPDRPGIITNLANAYRGHHRLKEAGEAYQRAIDQDDQFTEAYFGYGTTLRMAGMLEDAKVMLDHALALMPHHPDARFSRALVYLEQGNFTFGFADYEHRWDSSDFPGRSIAGTEWSGENVSGKTVLVHAEQGLGDTIQFARFIPMLSARGARVLFYVQPELATVAASLDGVDQIVPAGSEPPPFDYYVAVMSLPFHFGTTPASIPADTPYLTAPTVPTADLDTLLPVSAPELRVGLVWAGRPTHTDDRHRSCTLERLLPLADIPNVRLFSLQKEPRAEDGEFLNQVVDLGPCLTDFGVTATAMSRLDLIITVDTASAHLAGALGRPTWLLLAHRAEWRWALEDETSPWYPSMRLLRQHAQGDWYNLVRHVSAGLTQVLRRKA